MRWLRAAVLAMTLAACTDLQRDRLGLETDSFTVVPGGCPAAGAAPFRIERQGDQMVFVEIGSEAPSSMIWPFGFAAWLVEGEAILFASDGTIVGREGDILDNIGGAATAGEGFHVCSVGVRTYW